MIDFLIMYEVRVRELESILLLGTELKNRGYNVEYLSFDDVDKNRYLKNRKLLKRYFNNVRVVLMPSLYNDNEIYNTVYYVCGKVGKIVNLRWEQYFENYVMDDPNGYLFPKGSALKSFHVCWGKMSHDSLRNCGVAEEQLILSGPLHMDFLRKEFLDFYESKEALFSKYNLSEKKKTVLYISSFATATRTERLFTHVKKDFDGQYTEDERVYQFHRDSYEITLDWIEKYLELHQDTEFIYRPHPAENVTDRLEEIQKNYSNFHVISERSVKQWIVTCDIVTTWVSTSIVEAYFANKACYIVRPLPYDYDIDMCLYRGAKFVTSEQEFLNITNDCKEYTISDKMMQYCYDVDFGRASYLRLADELTRIMKDNMLFEWDEIKTRQFDKKRKWFGIRNLVFFVYLGILFALAELREKGKISYGCKINARVDNYLAVKRKTQYKSEKDDFQEKERQISQFIKTLS